MGRDSMLAYIAGPLFNEMERGYLEKINIICKKVGISTYLPHRDAGLQNYDNADKLFKMDIDALESSSVIVANLNGVDVDAGTAFELGYGFAKGKKLFGIHTDSRITEPFSEVNLMILKSCTICHSHSELEMTLSKYYKFKKENNIR